MSAERADVSVSGTHILGALGEIPPALRARLAESRSTWTVHDLADERVALLSVGRTFSWRSGVDRGVFWSPQGDIASIDGAEAATHDAVAPGIAVSHDSVTLHASAWGFQPVYVAALGTATLLFSTSSRALVDLLDGPLDPDWDAWAAILSLSYPVGGRTPFAQVRRLLGGEKRSLDPATRRFTTHREAPRALGADDPPASPGHIVEAIRAAMSEHPSLTNGPAHPSGYLASLPITGGWDSRLLGAVGVDVYGAASFRALTTSQHRDGADHDVTFGARVASPLGLTHDILFPDGRAFPSYAARSFDLVEHETWEHSWFEPAVSRLHARGLPVIDGLGGDVLMKNAIVSPALLQTPTADIGDQLWSTLRRPLAPDLPGITDSVTAELTDRVRPDFDRARAVFGGLPHEARLSVMGIRHLGAVSAAPFKMIASGVEVVTPFLAPTVTAAMLSVPWPRKNDGALAREILEAARPGLSALPSNNDKIPGHSTGRRRANYPESRAWTVRQLRVLDEFAAIGFTADDFTILHTQSGSRWRQRLMLLSCWLEMYAPRLSSTTPPWWIR